MEMECACERTSGVYVCMCEIQSIGGRPSSLLHVHKGHLVVLRCLASGRGPTAAAVRPFLCNATGGGRPFLRHPATAGGRALGRIDDRLGHRLIGPQFGGLVRQFGQQIFGRRRQTGHTGSIQIQRSGALHRGAVHRIAAGQRGQRLIRLALGQPVERLRCTSDRRVLWVGVCACVRVCYVYDCDCDVCGQLFFFLGGIRRFCIRLCRRRRSNFDLGNVCSG